MHKLKNRWRDNRSNFQIFLERMYRRYLDEKKQYQENDILTEYEYQEKYANFLKTKYENRNII